jgi:GNAT superfamily N-acetyltransferase
MRIRVVPATAERWPDVCHAFGPRAGNVDSCWCQRFRHHQEPDNQSALRQEIQTAPVPVGLLAYVDDIPAGWTRVVPRHTHPGVCGNRALQRILDADESAWWVACFAVRREHRGSGVGIAMLRGAVDYAASHGASVLEGHPVDVERLQAKPSPSAVFTGTMAMFQAVGFTEVGRTYRSRPVMRRALCWDRTGQAGGAR